MLVLSRRSSQSIVFPTLDIAVQILRVAGQTVRVGVEAPRSIPILREEVTPSAPNAEAMQTLEEAADSSEQQAKARHRLRGRLHTATMALYLAQQQIQSGSTRSADGTLRNALDALGHLENELAAASPAAKKPTRRRIRTLLIEDNPYESALLESYLRLNEVEVASAGDGQEALDYLSCHETPDAVLLDMRMPRCDGPRTVAAIRSNPSLSHLKIFAVSGSRPEETNVPTGPNGVDSWFTKPLNPARLVDTLTSSVG